MIDILWLLLPLAAASGWYVARRGQAKKPPIRADDNYYVGLNYLLNEEPDKAIDTFVEMLKVDTDTVETHLALGNLFRRRGEVERAIRLHQNLIARPALTREQRAQALLELGQDYMKAGLFDRAENLFGELRETKLHLKPTLKNLRTIYQQEKDWQACLEVSEALAKLSGNSLSLERAHYYCELALIAKKNGQVSQVQGYLNKALELDKFCVRAIHIQANIAVEQGRIDDAIKRLKICLEYDSEYLSEVLPQLVELYKSKGDLLELKQFLEQIVEHTAGCGADIALADLLKDDLGEKAAIDYLSIRLYDRPSLQGLIRIIELNARLPESDVVALLSRLRRSVIRLLEERPAYQCSKCGFTAKALHWQCPSCQSWSTVKRRSEIESVS